VTLPEPELEVGADDAFDTPLPDFVLLPVFELLELPVLELPDEPVPDEPVLDDPVLDELLELLPVPDEEVAELEAAPGRVKATAPAAMALTTPAVTVTARIRAWPRSRAVMARRVSCGRPLMGGVPASLAS
jgi:hypothetical protein